MGYMQDILPIEPLPDTGYMEETMVQTICIVPWDQKSPI
jgi:hypothetical protein